MTVLERIVPAMRNHLHRSSAVLAALCASPMLLAGCTGIEPAVIGAAAAAAETGTSVLSMGKLNAVYLADRPTVTVAVRKALLDAGLTITRDEFDPPYTHRFTAEDDRGSAVLVRVEHRTDRLTRYRFDVGLLGSDATAKILFQRTEFYLSQQHQQQAED